MQHNVDDPEWRVWWRRAFATFLVSALVIGLYLSFRPTGFEDEPELAGGSEATEATGGTETAEQETEEQPTEPEAGEQQPEEEEEEDDGELSAEEAQELIDAARDPEATTVQVLDAGGGSTATDEAADVLREMGYDVVAINASRTSYDQTTVLFTEGNEAEAAALPARDERFAEVAPNERLSPDVHLHVVVGPDWTN